MEEEFMVKLSQKELDLLKKTFNKQFEACPIEPPVSKRQKVEPSVPAILASDEAGFTGKPEDWFDGKCFGDQMMW